METTDLLSPRQALEDLAVPIALCFAALEAAIPEAAAFFQDRKKEVDGGLAASITRWGAKNQLKITGKGVLAIEEIVYYRSGRYEVRVLKAADGTLPAPGWSRAKRAFYCQQHQFHLFGDEEPAPEPETTDLHNVVILWDVDPEYTGPVTMKLAYPETGGISKKSVRAHWYCDIPHPAETITSTAGDDVAAHADRDLEDIQKRPSEGLGGGDDDASSD